MDQEYKVKTLAVVPRWGVRSTLNVIIAAVFRSSKELKFQWKPILCVGKYDFENLFRKYASYSVDFFESALHKN